MLVIGNGFLVTRDGDNSCYSSGAVAIDGGKIVRVGDCEEIKGAYPGAEFLDAKGGVIAPGFINAHNHIYSALARGLSINGYNPKGFLDILDGMWWTIDRNLTIDATRASADCTFIDCIESGVTTVVDHHAGYGAIEGSLFEIAESAKRFGVRANLCYEVSDRDGRDKMKAAVKENVDYLNWAEGQFEMFTGMMGMHAPFTLSDDTLNYVMSQKPDFAGCHIHVAEGIYDVQSSLKEHGKRPAMRLFDFGVMGEKSIFGHCTHVCEAEIDLIAETNTMVSHNPESNMGNAVGCPPVIRMMQKGVLVGLGTDGYTNDMLESYKVANILHKHALCDPTVAWSEIPKALFENNRLIMSRFLKDEIGVLKPGAHADVIVLDYTPNTPMTKDNVNSHFLFGMCGKNVVSTVIDGKVLMKNRELVGVDKHKVLADCREEGRKLASRINERG